MSDPNADQTTGRLRISASTPTQGVVVLAVAGDVDALTEAQFADALRQVWSRRPEVVALDLEAVPFMGSSGLSILVGAEQQARALNARFSVCAPSSSVRRALTSTALDRLLTIYPSTSAALAGNEPESA